MKHFQVRPMFLVAMIVVAVAARLLPHPPNFSPLAALALFGGASFSNRWLGMILPLCAMAISDLFLGAHTLLPVVYGCLLLNACLGRWAGDQLKLSRLIPAALLGSVSFFVLTNLGFWFFYCPLTWTGLITCYAEALPFYQWSLAGDLFFGAVLFGTLALAEGIIPSLRPSPRSAVEFA
ncbi:MAG: DUF6580 family putative transport protein [Pirellulaceae bacterium]